MYATRVPFGSSIQEVSFVVRELECNVEVNERVPEEYQQ